MNLVHVWPETSHRCELVVFQMDDGRYLLAERSPLSIYVSIIMNNPVARYDRGGKLTGFDWGILCHPLRGALGRIPMTSPLTWYAFIADPIPALAELIL